MRKGWWTRILGRAKAWLRTHDLLSPGQELPDGFQKSEYVEKTGFVDLIVERKDLASKIGTLLSILLKQNSVISSEQNETSEDSQSLTRAAS